MEDFRFFALQYLNEWCSDDRRFVAGLSPGRKEDDRRAWLCKAAAYYRVARNFKKCEEPRFGCALAALDAITNPVTEENVDSTVSDLAKTFQVTYGANAISAASKFLWIRYKSPVVIYDARAIGCLRTCGEKFGECDYQGYRREWLRQFADCEQSIRTACAELIRVKGFSLASASSDEEVARLVGNRWFHERVFDKYLWKAGG